MSKCLTPARTLRSAAYQHILLKPRRRICHPFPGRMYSTAATSIGGASSGETLKQKEKGDYLNVHRLVDAYRSRGHYKASIDPLGSPVVPRNGGKLPSLEGFGFTEADLDRQFVLEPGVLSQIHRNESNSATLRDIIGACEQAYCGKYSVEYDHVEDPVQKQWLRERLESKDPVSFSKEEKAQILDRLLWGSGFEKLLANKFPTEKRYGLDGVESLVPGIAALIDYSAQAHGVDHVVVGGCHRGRLALAGTVYGLPIEGILAEFGGRLGWGLLPGTIGDVKTHLGSEGVHITPEGNNVDISLVANPSHLESVDTVLQGHAHAAQRLAGERGRDSVLCLALHGDAAFTGQGVVYEALTLSNLSSYDVGGTVRLIVNNQIGFTANPDQSRSTTYCSDIAKFLSIPIFHVNSDSVEDVVFVCKLAAEWRAKFRTDVVIDLVCYRRFGHNEMDQPRFTQPLLYEKIASHKASPDIYIERLLSEGSFTMEEIKAKRKAVLDVLNEKFELSKTYVPKVQESPKAWKNLPTKEQQAKEILASYPTAIESSTLASILEKMTSAPERFTLHNNVKRNLAARVSAASQDNVDWTAGEALALGSLAIEGHHVRVLGEDAQRGTFSQRHAVFHDQTNGKTWTPLANLTPSQAPFLIENSPLSEYGAMGFEHGVSIADPNSLVVWEAQFGDFANTAQVIIDNYLCNSETKWGDRSGLVLSLPHGYDGQGPEHSSSRIERFLLLASEDGNAWPSDPARQYQDANLQVVYPSTPANYFHVLRRQLKRDFRKPLVVFFSKSLLRSPLTRSPKADFIGDSAFSPVISDPDHGISIGQPEEISRVILCTGQVYAALKKYREFNNIRDVAITRIEELNPFPFTELKKSLDTYANAKTIVWAQEEPYNGGAWHHVRDRVSTVLRESEKHISKQFVYAGRPVSATTAAGSKKAHAAEEKAMSEDAFEVIS